MSRAARCPACQASSPDGLPASQQWTFGITIDQQFQGTLIADYFARDLHVKTVGVVRENDNTLKPGTAAFIAEAGKLGLKVVDNDVIDQTQSQFLSEASKIASNKPQACWLYMAPTNAAAIGNETSRDGFHPVFFANSVSWNLNLALTAGSSGFGSARAFSPWPSLADKRTSFLRANYSTGGAAALMDLGIPGWGIGQIIAAAIKSAGKDLGRNSFRNAMQNLKLGTTSPVEGTPLLWLPLDFTGNKRVGGNSLVTYKTTGSGAGLQWTTCAMLRRDLCHQDGVILSIFHIA